MQHVPRPEHDAEAYKEFQIRTSDRMRALTKVAGHIQKSDKMAVLHKPSSRVG